VWQEGREGKERLMSATLKQRKNRVRECYLETREGSLLPRVKAANKITCDYERDKLYLTPISVTCSKWYIRKAPFCSRGSAFGLKSIELLLTSLINLLPEIFGALSVSV
jgi:hypothetical protein